MKCIDLRSDTVTVPTKEMKKAFLMAEYGDLNRNEDPVVIELEREVTQILGK